MKISYSELIQIKSFEERFEYCKLGGKVASTAFVQDRILGQAFYHSVEWRRFRDHIIIRDNACDLAHPEHEILYHSVYIHHLNPITEEDIEDRADCLFDPENVICVCMNTHNAIHYGTVENVRGLVIRKPNDTCPWK